MICCSFFQPGYLCLGMAPVVDGPGGILPEMPLDLREAGNFNHNPMLSGITKDDGSLYVIVRKYYKNKHAKQIHVLVFADTDPSSKDGVSYAFINLKKNKRSKDLGALLDSCSWDDTGNFFSADLYQKLTAAD